MEMIRVEVRDVTGQLRSTDETSLDAAKDWLWRTLATCRTAEAAFGPASVRVFIIHS